MDYTYDSLTPMLPNLKESGFRELAEQWLLQKVNYILSAGVYGNFVARNRFSTLFYLGLLHRSSSWSERYEPRLLHVHPSLPQRLS